MPKYSFLKSLSLSLFLSIFFIVDIQAQSKAIIPVSDSQVYELISRMQDRGYFTSLNPERMPYTEEEVFVALKNMNKASLGSLEKIWIERLGKHFQSKRRWNKPGNQKLRFDVNAGMALNNSKRKDMYRPLRKDFYTWPFIQVQSLYQIENLVLNAEMKFDFYYEQDPDGIDATNRWYTRNENSYIGFSNDYLKVYLGRFSNYWGLYDGAGAFITDNPRTFDHLNFTIGKGRLSFQNIYGYLDAISGDDIFRGDTQFETDSKKRFAAIKRLDWRISDNVLFSYKEALIQSGLNSNPEIKYLIPSTVFAFLEGNNPYDDALNLLFGGSFWFRLNQVTFRSELLIDDIIFDREGRGITERGNFSWNMDGTYTFKKAPLNINLNAEVVSYQAYNTDQAEGRYLFLKRGIATQYDDYVFSEIKADWFAEKLTTGLRISPYYGLLLQGEQVINQEFDSDYPNGDPYEFVLTGVVERNNRAGVDLFYSPVSYFWIKADLGANFVQNSNHQEGVSEAGFIGSFEFGIRYDFSLGF